MGWRLGLLYLTVVSSISAQDPPYLLPKGLIVPFHYDLKLVYDIDPSTNFSFYGVVDILLTASELTSDVSLHKKGFTIDIDRVTLTGEEQSFKVISTKEDEKYDILKFTFDGSLEIAENYTLTIPFYGNLKMGLDGVYISSYQDKATKTKEYLVTTQFEAKSARNGFPCFDEPMYKATFSINIGHEEQYTAVSNMPLFNTSDDNIVEDYFPWTKIEGKFKKPKSNFVFDLFETSVPMSTYLVAFVVSKFKYVESPKELSNTKFRIWARADAIDQSDYASTVGPKVLSFYEKFFNVPFPLPKQDMFAIPDFSAGAMENWGLITYRETALLYDKKQSSFSSRQRVAEVISHELAHQWFGNLVTMKWWSDLWLNEGFATYVASLGVNAVEPEWLTDESEAVSNTMSVFNLDALESSHPVSVPIDDPNRIPEIFDDISYLKGSTLNRMMSKFLGEEVFRKALHNYLVKYSYSNAEQDDLWRELTYVAQQYNVLTRNVTVKEIMDTWTKQTGYPLLTVERDYSGDTLTVTQKRYLALGSKSKTDVSWWVPLNVLCQNDVDKPQPPIEWLSNNEGTVSMHRYNHGAASDEWLLFNADLIAPVRVNYDSRNWQLLSSALNSENFHKIPTLSRVQLLVDSFALAWVETLDYDVPLQLTNYLRKEDKYLPLNAGLGQLAKMENIFKRTPDYGIYQKFVRKLITETYHKVGGLAVKRIVNEEDLNSLKMQTITSSWACRVKVPGAEENAIDLFQQWMETSNPDEENPIPLDLRQTVYCTALARGSVSHWRFAFARMKAANVAAARMQLLSSLSCTREVWLLSQLLEWAIADNSEIRRQDAPSVIAGVTHSIVGYYVGKDFIYNRIDELAKTFSGQKNRIGRVVSSMLSQFTKQEELDEFLQWREKYNKYLVENKLSIEQGIEKARVNIAWAKKNRAKVVAKMRELTSMQYTDGAAQKVAIHTGLAILILLAVS